MPKNNDEYNKGDKSKKDPIELRKFLKEMREKVLIK